MIDGHLTLWSVVRVTTGTWEQTVLRRYRSPAAARLHVAVLTATTLGSRRSRSYHTWQTRHA